MELAMVTTTQHMGRGQHGLGHGYHNTAPTLSSVRDWGEASMDLAMGLRSCSAMTSANVTAANVALAKTLTTAWITCGAAMHSAHGQEQALTSLDAQYVQKLCWCVANKHSHMARRQPSSHHHQPGVQPVVRLPLTNSPHRVHPSAVLEVALNHDQEDVQRRNLWVTNQEGAVGSATQRGQEGAGQHGAAGRA